MQNIGVDASDCDYSLGYVATWAQNKDVIHEALSEIQKVSNKVVDLSNELTEKLGLQQEKGNKISESLEEVAKEKLVVQADNPVEAVKNFIIITCSTPFKIVIPYQMFQKRKQIILEKQLYGRT